MCAYFYGLYILGPWTTNGKLLGRVHARVCVGVLHFVLSVRSYPPDGLIIV